MKNNIPCIVVSVLRGCVQPEIKILHHRASALRHTDNSIIKFYEVLVCILSSGEEVTLAQAPGSVDAIIGVPLAYTQLIVRQGPPFPVIRINKLSVKNRPFQLTIVPTIHFSASQDNL